MNEPSPPPEGGGSPPRRASSSSLPATRVLSAARAVVPPPPKRTGPLQERLKEGAADTALNFASVLREKWQDFQGSDRTFKYKVLILGVWLALSGLGLAVAWPEQTVKTETHLGARLVLGEHTDRPVYVIMNESDVPWKDVTVTVNGTFRASSSGVDPHQEFALTPKQLVGRNGKLAPADLQARDILLHTHAGDAVLLRDGQPP